MARRKVPQIHVKRSQPTREEQAEKAIESFDRALEHAKEVFRNLIELDEVKHKDTMSCFEGTKGLSEEQMKERSRLFDQKREDERSVGAAISIMERMAREMGEVGSFARMYGEKEPRQMSNRIITSLNWMMANHMSSFLT